MGDLSGERRFESGDALRSAAEQEARRKLTDDEWNLVDPDGWSAQPNSDYSDSDLADLVEAIGQTFPPQKPSAADRQWKQALAHTERTATEARAFVEKERRFLFGQSDPPFKDDARAAADWIESEAAQRGSILFRLEVAVPREHAEGLEPLFWIRDWLVADLASRDVQDTSFEAVRNFMLTERSPIRHIDRRTPTLAYLAPTNGSWGIKRVHADDGTTLGNLREACDKLAQATEWTQLASCHHLLTGGVMSSPVGTIPRLRFGRDSFGGSSIAINIPNPSAVRADEVARAYNEARSQVMDVRHPKRARKRATLSPKREKLASFVTETPRMTWPQRCATWNERYPEYGYKTHDAMRQAFRRL